MKKEEKKTINLFDSDHIDWLKDKLSFIQKNQFADTLYDRENPLRVTKAELDFICDEDKKSQRFFMDYHLEEYHSKSKTYTFRWVRDPYLTDAQVKRYLSYYFSKKCKDKISNLRITSEKLLEQEVIRFRYDTNEDVKITLREYWFDERYKPWTQEENFSYKDNFFESKEMYDLLVSFYKFGFVVISEVPTQNNFIVKFANSIGSVRRTNFGEYFDVKSKPDPNDLAYTSLHLAPHTDNPYRNPVPCIQLLHCIENEVSGGFSTLVDGYTVTEDLKNENPDFYKILTEVKVKFKFIDKEVVLEDWSELIKLNDDKTFKQVRFSPRLDYVPMLDKDKLDLYYKARKKLSEMYNSDKYRVEFKLAPKDLLMMDNHRLLHGRTAYETKEGKRFLQGCYIDYDSTEGKLRHLKRKFNL